MKRFTTEILAELRQLDPERPQDPGPNDFADTSAEMILARVLAAPQTQGGLVPSVGVG